MIQIYKIPVYIPTILWFYFPFGGCLVLLLDFIKKK